MFWLCDENGQHLPRVRSVSMNEFIGEVSSNAPAGQSWWVPGWRAYTRESNLGNPSPTFLWLFADEHADSINDGFLTTDVETPGFGDGPANYHGGANGFAFVDGHAEIHKWLLPQCWPAVHASRSWTFPGIAEPATGPDVLWMVPHSSARLNP